MEDPSINVYDVIAEGEAYFKDKPKGMGTGYKDFQRWKYYHEGLFYPTGDRSNYHPQQDWDAFHEYMNRKGYLARGAKADTVWTELGPWHANNITTHYSPGLGRIDAVWVNPLDSNMIYIGARNGGFWRTTDEGQTWENSMDQTSRLGVNALAVSPNDPDTVIVRTTLGPYSGTSGLWYSDDGGYNWSATVWNNTMNDNIRQIKFSPKANGEMYLCSNKGLYISDDYFATWTKLLTGNVYDFEFQPNNPDRMYLRANTWNDSIMISTDAGNTWFGSHNNVGGNGGELAVTAADSNYVYFGRSNGVWRSTDAGITWSNMGAGPGGLYGGFGVSDTDKDRVIQGDIDTHLSTDGGQNFTKVTFWSNPGNTTKYVHADIREVICLQGRFYLGTDGYLAKSNNGGTLWTRHSDGCGVREFYRIGTSPTHAYHITGGSQDNGTSWMEGDTWYEWMGADGMECAYHRSNPDIFYGEWQYGGLHVTTTGGNNWPNIKPPGVGNGSWITPFVMDYNHPYTIYIGFDSLWKSTNNGSNWTNIGGFSEDLDDMAISEKNSDLILVSNKSDLVRTTNGGTTWDTLSGPLPNQTITDIAIHPEDNDTIVVTYSNTGQKIWLTMDGGNTWSKIAFDLPNLSVYGVQWDTHPVDRLYVGTRVGVYEKLLTDSTWNSYIHNMPWGYIREIEIHKGANLLRAAYYGRGLWEAPLIGKEEYPQIVSTDILPLITTSHPTQHQDVDIRSWITAVDGVKDAWIEWSAGTPTFANTIQMSAIAPDTFKTVTKIPKQAANTLVWFKVWAVDSVGDTSFTDRIVYRVEPYTCTTNPTALPSPDTTICPGEQTVISSLGGWMYTWNQGLGDGQAHTVSPTVTTTYTVVASDINGCSGTDSLTVTVKSAPSVNLGPDTAGCASVTLDAGGGLGNTYAWSNGGNNQTTSANLSGVYSVEVTSANGCTNSDTINVTVHQPAIVGLSLGFGDTLCENDSAQVLSGGNPAGGTYSGTGVNTGMFDPGTAGQGVHMITYSYVDSNGCSGTANDSVQVIDCSVSSANPLAVMNFKAFPNPASEEVMLTWDHKAGREFTIVLSNELGQVLKKWEDQSNGKLLIPREQISSGIYFIQVSESGNNLGGIKLIFE